MILCASTDLACARGRSAYASKGGKATRVIYRSVPMVASMGSVSMLIIVHAILDGVAMSVMSACLPSLA